MTVRFSAVLMLTCALALAGCLGDSGSDDESEGSPAQSVTGTLPEEGNDLFVLRGPAVVSDGRIDVDTETVEWFTDRPERRAGVATAEELVERWDDYDFVANPPNAAIAGDETDAEVVLTQPQTSPDGLSFAFEVIRGEVAEGDDDVSVFVDTSGTSTFNCQQNTNNATTTCTWQSSSYMVETSDLKSALESSSPEWPNGIQGRDPIQIQAWGGHSHDSSSEYVDTGEGGNGGFAQTLTTWSTLAAASSEPQYCFNKSGNQGGACLYLYMGPEADEHKGAPSTIVSKDPIGPISDPDGMTSASQIPSSVLLIAGGGGGTTEISSCGAANSNGGDGGLAIVKAPGTGPVTGAGADGQGGIGGNGGDGTGGTGGGHGATSGANGLGGGGGSGLYWSNTSFDPNGSIGTWGAGRGGGRNTNGGGSGGGGFGGGGGGGSSLSDGGLSGSCGAGGGGGSYAAAAPSFSTDNNNWMNTSDLRGPYSKVELTWFWAEEQG